MTPFFTQKTKYRKNQTANSGFTLVELLAVVAILLLVGLIAVFSLNKLRRTLRQHELDAKAQIIYVAAQNRLAELRAAGQEALCINGLGETGAIVHKMEYDGTHMDESSEKIDFYYLLVNENSDKSQTAATALLPSSAVDQELWNGYWCIEFAPKTGSIYAVFYSESPLPDHDDLNGYYRNFNYRLKDTAVGYYGGDIAQTQDISKFNPSITIENAEKLIVTFYCNNPVSEKMTFKIDISDKDGGTYTRTITNFAHLDRYNRKYQWILDSLAREEGIGDAGAARFAAQTNYQVSCGTPITITLTVSSANPSVDTVSTSRTTNGLFDDRADLSYGENTALVSCGRHLANLDSSSGVNSTITSAVQISDISFSDDPADPSDWYSLYTAKDVNFKPISNNRITSYVGLSSIGGITARHAINGLAVSSAAPAGLFSNFSGEISNVTLVNANIGSSTSAAGALVGRATGSLKLANCRVYLADSDLSSMKAASASEIPPRITGTHAGGLVGVYENSSTGNTQANGTLIIENSFAATTINSTTAAAGLVGHAAGAVSVSQSYADCYLTAPTTGGLVGTTTGSGGLTLSDSYAAGYQTATDSAAGFVAGHLTSAKQSYSACAYLGAGAVHTTAKSGTITINDKVFYLTSGLEGKQRTDLSNTSGKSYVDMSAAQFLTELGSTAFAAASADTTHPYNLLGQGLSTYSYPRLVNLSHYGDWQAEFETEALVYYERYEGDTVGFFGGNVDNLDDGKTILGDGYAVALSAPLNGSLTVTYNGNSVTLSGTTTSFTSSYGGTTYYLYPVDMLTTSTDTTTTNFYHSVTVNGRTYQFNPYFAKTVTTGSGAGVPATVYLRTARHLYELSRRYGDLAAATANTTFRQERDINYADYWWTTYTSSTAAVTSQEPIHSAVNAADVGDTGGFRAVYDGGGHIIRGVSFASEGNDVGMFAVIAPSGTVRNVALLSDDNKSTVERSELIQGSTTVVYMGALAGRNYGTVSNCAVSGYAFGGASGVAAYQHSTVYLGGLVGGNLYHKTHSGRIVSSEANCPLAEVSAYSAAVYAGGFTGSNAGGSIQSCYALGVLKARDVSASTVRLCGFAGENAGGALAYCYSATALTAAGEAEVYGLTRVGGSAAQCYYLDGGTYAYGEGLYAYNVSGNSFRVNAAQSPINGANLETRSLYGFTKLTASGTEAVYPYPAVVRDAASKTVHYGPWPKQRHIGTMGVFYWEREQGGNAGYHLSYIGTDNGVAFSGSTLCVQHNDSGVVMEYGYGYFFKPGGLTDTVRLDVSANCYLGAVNEAAGSALKAQMPEYEFVAYTTGSMYLTDKETNCTWTLKYGEAKSVYTLCPFFADAMSLDSITDTQFSDAHKPGTAGKPYQVRSVSQLQNINWNYVELDATSSIKGAPEQMPFKDDQGENYWSACPYLVRYQPEDTTHVKNNQWRDRRDAAITLISNSGKGLYWAQSHDVDAYVEVGKADDNFTPIGGLQDIMEIESPYSKPCTAFFAGSFDGQDYTIRNISITSSAQCVGLFGFTSGAQLRNIIMYSDRGSVIKNTADGQNWYCLGGLVGFAGAGSDDTSTAALTNCSVSGYTIQDNWKNKPGWGGGCVGGLVGATNMNITGCTAVTDIVLNIAYENAYANLRVGGIVGVCRATLDKCYAGGSIKSTSTVPLKNSASISTSIWASGLVGGIMLRYEGGLSKLVGKADSTLYVKNSYTFVEMPESGKNTVRRSMSIASNGEMQVNDFAGVNNSTAYIENCYALADAVQNTYDYKEKKDANWNGQVELSYAYANVGGKRWTYLTNSGKTPYITYEQMQTKLKDLLNGGASASSLRFDTVTVTENGAPIPGKYSFPGANAEMLDGLDFPFPTILTQKDVAGRTVNVHYGRWPTSGLYWERTRTTLDLCADRSGEGAPTLTVALYQYPAVTDATDTPKIALVNDTDGKTSDLLDWTAPVYNSAERCWKVTFTGKERTGLVIARAKLGGHTAEMTIDVTQTLLLTSDKAASGVSVRYGGESETVQLTLTDAKNKPIAVKDGESLTWEVTATKQGGGYDSGAVSIVTCGDVTAVDAAKGLYQFTVSGFSGGISTVSVTCTYTYPEGTGQKSVTARLLLNAKSTRDAVGLVYDMTADTRVYTVANGVYRSELNDTPQAGTADVTVPEFSREVGKLYLFAGSGYTKLEDFEVSFDGLSAVDAEGKTVAVTATPGAIQTAEGVQYREVTFSGTEALISGDIVLTHKDGAVYTLHLEKYTYKPTT